MTPVVGIIMGSDSDLPVMKKAAEMLDQLKVPNELTIVSAHRTPDRLTDYAKSAAGKGLKVIIAGAGGSAHLPGMVAAQTVLPVIGVPVQTKALGGVDSLYSIVQMPPGVSVATVGINAGLNAAVLATQILALCDKDIHARFETYRAGLAAKIVKANQELKEVRYEYKVN